MPQLWVTEENDCSKGVLLLNRGYMCSSSCHPSTRSIPSSRPGFFHLEKIPLSLNEWVSVVVPPSRLEIVKTMGFVLHAGPICGRASDVIECSSKVNCAINRSMGIEHRVSHKSLV